MTSHAIFMATWESLVDMLGSATAATLVRRAAARAASRCPELTELCVAREHLEYRCVLPPSWNEAAPGPALKELFAELTQLLIDLTGTVVVDRLRTIPALEQSGLFSSESAS